MIHLLQKSSYLSMLIDVKLCVEINDNHSTGKIIFGTCFDLMLLEVSFPPRLRDVAITIISDTVLQ